MTIPKSNVGELYDIDEQRGSFEQQQQNEQSSTDQNNKTKLIQTVLKHLKRESRNLSNDASRDGTGQLYHSHSFRPKVQFEQVVKAKQIMQLHNQIVTQDNQSAHVSSPNQKQEQQNQGS